MATLQYSVIVNHPLHEVVSHLEQLEAKLNMGPEGGMRFKTIPSGTYVTVFGAGSDVTPDVLTSLIDSMVTPRTDQRTAA